MDWIDRRQFETPKETAEIDQEQARMRDVVLNLAKSDSTFLGACLMECERIQLAYKEMTPKERENLVIHLAPHSAMVIAILAMYGWNSVTEKAFQEAKDGKASPR